MKILVLGGTHFVGRHFVHRALEQGHEVTLFNRGQSDPGAFPDVEHLIGDRNGDYAALEGRRWDLVIDPSAFLPQVAEQTCAVLATAVEHYLLVSTTGVYDSRTNQEWLDEDSTLVTPSSPSSKDVHRTRDYGGLKAICERIVDDAMGGRMLAIRPGLIAGRDDLTDRFTYWPRRVAEGGDVILPASSDIAVQVIDVRDLTGWALDAAEQGLRGAYNCTGDQVTLEDVFETCKEATGSDARPVRVDEDFLLEHGVKDWTVLPLWCRRPQRKGAAWVRNDRAKAAGLALRPLVETARDLWEWDAARPRPLHRGPVGARYVVETLTPEREAEVLEVWRSRAAV